jgi:hypothetical protein
MKIAKLSKAKIWIIIFFVAQICVWFFAHTIKPKYIITPFPPTKTEIEAMSFGDRQLLFRMLVFKIQNAGDAIGQYHNFNEYDYKKLRTWFEALDDIDSHSEYIPYMAAYYYSIVRSVEKSKIIADYIANYASADPQKHWRLMTTALYIYKTQVPHSENEIYAIGELLLTQKIPMWAKALAAFFLKESGDLCASYELIMKVTADEEISSDDNIQDRFLIETLNENIEQLKKHGRDVVSRCEGKFKK